MVLFGHHRNGVCLQLNVILCCYSFTVVTFISVLQWFTPAEFGMWYSVLNTTMNMACSIGPILTAFITAMISWRASMTIYGKEQRAQAFLSSVACLGSFCCCMVWLWNHDQCVIHRYPSFCINNWDFVGV